VNLISSLNVKLRNFKKYEENSWYLKYYKPSIGREYAKWIPEEISEEKWQWTPLLRLEKMHNFSRGQIVISNKIRESL
jgi:hypothetical protein